MEALLWLLLGGSLGYLVGGWAHKPRRGLVLALLESRGEMTGRQFRDAGLGAEIYVVLYALEREGLIESRSDGIEHPERGGLSRRFYRLREQP